MSGTNLLLEKGTVPVTSWKVPREKARARSYSFQGPGTFNIELLKAAQEGRFTQFQTVWIDNAANGSATQFHVDQTGQTVQMPASSQGYIRVQCSEETQITITTAGTARVDVILINVPIETQIWTVSAGSGIVVSDPIVDAAVTSANPGPEAVNAMQVAGIYNSAAPTLTTGESVALQVTSGGALIVNDEGIANATIAPGSTGNPDSFPWLAKVLAYPQSYTTGQFQWPVMSPDGALNMRIVEANLNAGSAPVGGATDLSALQISGAYNASPPAPSSGQAVALQMDSAGNLHTSDAIINSVDTPIGASTAAPSALQIAGVYELAGVSLVNGQAAALQMNAQGFLKTADLNLENAVKGNIFTPQPAAVSGMQIVGGYNASGVTLTNGQVVILQMSQGGSVLTQGGYGTGDVNRPAFTAFVNAAVNGAISSALSVALLTPTAGIFIKRIVVSLVVASTAPATLSIDLDQSSNLYRRHLIQTSATPTGEEFTLEMDWLSPNSNAAITLNFGTVAGLTGSYAISIVYAQTALIGP